MSEGSPLQTNVETNKTITLIVTTAASFLTPFMGSAVNIALPIIGREFVMSAVLLGWVAYAFLLATAAVLVPVGRLSDRWGRKRIFTIGLIVFALSSFFCAAAASPLQLIAFRVLQGVGSAMIFGTSIAILTSVFPAGERGRVLGINVAFVYLGLSVGPFLGGFLTEHFGWRSIFMIPVLLSVMVLFLLRWKMTGEWAEEKAGRFDVMGALLYMAALAAIMYGFSSLLDRSGLWVTLAGLVLMTLFLLREKKVPNALLDIALFRRNTAFIFSNLAALINYSATYAVSFLLSLYLQIAKGFSPFEAGLILVAQPVVQALFSPFAGRLSDRMEPRIVASIGMGLTALGLGLFALLNNHGSLLFIVANLFLLGLGFALFSSPNTNAIMSSVESRFYGLASGTLATMRLTGQMVSMAIIMLIFTIHTKDVPLAREGASSFLSSQHSAFITLFLLCSIGIFASLARGNVHTS